MVFWLSIAVSIFAILKSKDTGRINRWDILFLLSSWQTFNLGIWQNAIADYFSGDTYPIMACILMILVISYSARREIEIKFNFSKANFLVVLTSILILAGLLIPLGLHIGFLKLNPNLNHQHIARTIISYYMFVAPTEEIVFRGVIFNLLEKTYKTWFALLATTILFAAIYTHLSGNGIFPNWQYVGLAFGAGLVYGISYMKSRNILVPIFVHGSVDTIWRVFLS